MVEMLREAATWTADRGFPTWCGESFTVAEQLGLAEAGELVGGFDAGRLVASMRLQRTDRIHWSNDPPGEALYVHKLVVRRCAAGTGWPRRLLDWAMTRVAEQQAQFLRLDTFPFGPLPALYEQHGFLRVGSEPDFIAGRWIVRMEKPSNFRTHIV
ncbi:GNAT family N-acetyltransferase [Rhizobium sp. 60-20]|uniref:GNAT family N-acetyltransferase n=1 Tax=Rhizobium sp. 60-20 TaxID=1895819 RepID=UPI001AC5BEC9|nr:GNAT family N-acetyltransferase [Rhizobium sp. 60-20]MBN8949861.1 GNAT family N-acetyltransferase [Rhizobium tropici]